MIFLSIILLAAAAAPVQSRTKSSSISVPSSRFATAVQAPPPSKCLRRAFSAFAAADADRDGMIQPAEARAIPVAPDAFAGLDEDRDGAWSRDEFLFCYRRQLLAAGQSAGPDLEAEIARIQALKRVRVVEGTRKLRTETSARAADADSVEQRLETALAELQARAADRKATREDVHRLRNLVILSGRAAPATRGNPRTASSQAGMLQALERIERQTSLGQYVQRDFEALKAFTGSRAGNAPRNEPWNADGTRLGEVPTVRSPERAGSPATARDGAPPPATRPVEPSASGGPADVRRRATPPKVEPRIQPTPAPSKRPVPRPAPVDRPPAGKPDKDKPARP